MCVLNGECNAGSPFLLFLSLVLDVEQKCDHLDSLLPLRRVAKERCYLQLLFIFVGITFVFTVSSVILYMVWFAVLGGFRKWLNNIVGVKKIRLVHAKHPLCCVRMCQSFLNVCGMLVYNPVS